jgi:hypothetical protein
MLKKYITFVNEYKSNNILKRINPTKKAELNDIEKSLNLIVDFDGNVKDLDLGVTLGEIDYIFGDFVATKDEEKKKFDDGKLTTSYRKALEWLKN